MMVVQDTILEGPDANKVLSQNIDLLQKKTNESLSAWSLFHGGPGLPVLNKNAKLMQSFLTVDCFNCILYVVQKYCD